MLNVARKLMRGSLAYRGGNRVWVHSGHSTGTKNDSGNGAAFDASGNLFLSGYQSTDLLPAFVAKIDPGGTLQWQRKQSMTNRYINIGGVGVDSSGNCYQLGHGYVTASPDLPHLVKYNSAGTLQWQRKLTTATSTSAYGLSVNGAGDCYGAFVEATATNTSLLAKYNTSGTLQWQRKLSSTYSVSLQATALATDGGVIGAGYFFDGGSAAANIRGIVVKYDSSGAIQWQTKVHWSIQGGMTACEVDQVTGDIYIGGSYTSAAQTYAVLVKLNSAGTVQWTRRHPTATTDTRAIAVDASTGNVYAWVSAGRLVCLNASGTLQWERVFTCDASTLLSITYARGLAICNGELLIAGQAQHSGAGQGQDAVLIRMNVNGGAATTAGYVVITVPSTTTFDTTAPTTAAAGLTDAAGAHTDAAGGLTDAAGTVTFTNYSN